MVATVSWLFSSIRSIFFGLVATPFEKRSLRSNRRMVLNEAIPKKPHYGHALNSLNIEGVWNLLQPIRTDMELVQLGNAVRGTYQNSEVKGTIEGTLTKDGEDNILTGKWADQLGAGDFRVTIGYLTSPTEVAMSEECVFMEIGSILKVKSGMEYSKE